MAFSIAPGVWPVMITPWTDDNKPDFKAIGALCNWYIEKGCTGIFAVCQSSEMAYLSLRERVRLAQTVVDAAAGRLDVVAALLSGDRNTFETFRCEAPELMHAPIATFEWYEKNYLDRDYPIRLIMRLNGVQFPN